MRRFAACIAMMVPAVMLVGGMTLVAEGHEGGLTVVDEVGGYEISTTYEPDEITTITPVRFDFELADADTGEDISVTDAWVRVTKDSKTYFAAGIDQPAFGKLGLLYVFPEEGQFEVHVRFQNDNNSLVETSVPISVTKADVDMTLLEQFSLWWLLIGLFLGGGLGALLFRRFA